MTSRMVLDAGAQFGRVDSQARTVSGLLVEWGAVARSGGRRWRFARGSLYWSDVSRVKLNRDHERRELVGVATELQSGPRGLFGTFRVAEFPEGDEVLRLARDGVLDGFSVEVDFGEDDQHGPDPGDSSVTLVRRGRLVGVALTGTPAFDEARVGVLASRDSRLEVRLSGDEVEQVRMAADRTGQPVSELVRGSLRAYTRPRPPYSFTGAGGGHSFVQDSWLMYHPLDGDAVEARARLEAFRGWQSEVKAEFTTATTGNASEVVEPDYRPLLADWIQDRPLFAAASRGTLSDATAFQLPAEVVDANVGPMVSTHTEGSPPGEGTLEFTGMTVSPVGISGRLPLTREIADSSNPAIDSVALQVMRESFARQSEARIYEVLNTVQAGAPGNGATARTSTGSALPGDVRAAVLGFPAQRGMAARSVTVSANTTVAEALDDLDMDHFALRAVTVGISPQIPGSTAGDGDVFILGAGDLWAWVSPLMEFRYFERSGPHTVELALFGYFATRVIAPRGVAAIRHD